MKVICPDMVIGLIPAASSGIEPTFAGPYIRKLREPVWHPTAWSKTFTGKDAILTINGQKIGTFGMDYGIDVTPPADVPVGNAGLNLVPTETERACYFCARKTNGVIEGRKVACCPVCFDTAFKPIERRR